MPLFVMVLQINERHVHAIIITDDVLHIELN